MRDLAHVRISTFTNERSPDAHAQTLPHVRERTHVQHDTHARTHDTLLQKFDYARASYSASPPCVLIHAGARGRRRGGPRHF
eukprot:4428535-Pleurochrysis_carterae.AAC.1